ncbi:MAG: type II secretion system F family protein [Rhodospirillales bacterium]
MSQQGIILIIVGAVASMLAIGGLIIGATYIIRPRLLLRKRMSQIGVIGDGAVSEKGEGRRQKRIQEKIKQLEQKGEKKGRWDALEEDILQAGMNFSVGVYLIISACVGVLCAFFVLMAGLNPLIAIPALLLGGLGFPKLFLKFIARRRQKLFTQNFAEAIDVIVRGIRSGLPVNECFNIIAREYGPPLGEEFRLIVEGQRLGIEIEELMRRGLRRLPTSEYKFFAIVTQIQKQTGGNLAETLGNLSGVLRERKKMRDKIQAYSSEAKASAMIIGSLPFVVGGLLSVVNPDYIALLFTETKGNYMLAGGAFWMLCGIGVMSKMINFEI